MPQYPFDDTGLSPTNAVIDEVHVVTELNYRDFNFIVPLFSPFFEIGLELEHISETGEKTSLEQGIDYNLSLAYLGATRALGTPVYGGLTLSSRINNGLIRIKKYQTVGDIWVADRDRVLKALSDLVYNPRITTWDLVTNVQQIFPPASHRVHVSDLTGMSDLITSIDRIALAVSSPENRSQSSLNQLLLATLKTDVADLKTRLDTIEITLGL